MPVGANDNAVPAVLAARHGRYQSPLTWATDCSMARSSIVPGPSVTACPFLAG